MREWQGEGDATVTEVPFGEPLEISRAYPHHTLERLAATKK